MGLLKSAMGVATKPFSLAKGIVKKTPKLLKWGAIAFFATSGVKAIMKSAQMGDTVYVGEGIEASDIKTDSFVDTMNYGKDSSAASQPSVDTKTAANDTLAAGSTTNKDDKTSDVSTVAQNEANLYASQEEAEDETLSASL